jgi:hypothetical protein
MLVVCAGHVGRCRIANGNAVKYHTKGHSVNTLMPATETIIGPFEDKKATK